MIGLLGTVGFLIAGHAGWQTPASVSPSTRVQENDPVIARIAEMHLPRIGRATDNVTILDVRAEGRTLVFKLQPRQLMSELGPEHMVSVIARDLCRSHSDVFGEGRLVRVEFVENDSLVRHATTDHCPSRSEFPQVSPTSYAIFLRRYIGERVGGRGGLFIGNARADGAMLVVTVNGPVGWRNARPVQYAETEFLRGFCRNTSQVYFHSGQTLRIDTVEAGEQHLEGRIFDQCPPRSSRRRTR